ncbi:hypothetical protein ACE1B6_00765 [Aerosakkonemataceae cyanobacterium BLCC-F154]|uniref:Uncharacterized protein n=1 Tax=Floridaenema fluviatile BLCC-F154 TaxID=3153640 RepID=A0ABV4Y5K2_9CYAN
MNFKLIVFSSLLTAIIGATIGFAVGELFKPKFSSQIYQDIHRQYSVIGGVGGLVVGGCQEVIRQLKKQRDEEDRERREASVQKGESE